MTFEVKAKVLFVFNLLLVNLFLLQGGSPPLHPGDTFFVKEKLNFV